MFKFTEDISTLLRSWYKSRNFFLRFLSQAVYYIVAHLLYWINHGKQEIFSVSERIDEMRSQGRKVTSLTRLDIIYEFIFHGFMTCEYVSYHFEDKSFKERKIFYSEMDHWKFTNICNRRCDIWKLKNKRLSYEIFKDWYRRDQIIVKSKNDLNSYIEFISKHPKFFIKPYDGCGGANSGWFNSIDYASPEDSLDAILKNGAFVLEEGVYQCKAMASFNPDSINTLRIVTIRKFDDIINWFAFIRTGRKGCSVDNGGKGGIIVGVDINTGELNTDGFNEQGVQFECHPDSGIKFKGFKLPYWKDSLEMAIKMMDVLPSINCIGWDFALTDNGPVVIEANGQTALIGPQITKQKGIRKECEEILMTLK